MQRIFLVWFSLCCILFAARAEHEGVNLNPSDANIFGHVVDKKSGEHISYVNIFLEGTTIGTVTDATGHYSLTNLPEGEFQLVLKSIGYQTVKKKVVLKKGKTLEVNFEAEEDAVSLDGVVVSANRNETTRRMAPSLVNVLDSKVFESSNAVSLAEGLNFQPGVRVENNCQNCGFQQVRINGLDGPYTQILVDSRPIFSALTGVYGLEQIPANMIERVEVMRGGGSALFGSSAIAGTINIITKEPLRNSAQVSHSLTMVGGSSADNNTTVNASLVTDDQKAGIYVFGQSRIRDPYDHDGDGYSEEWKQEAARRGLTNICHVPEALMHYVDDQSRSVFIGEHIFNETELNSRLEVELEKFTMKVQIESRVLGDLAINHIVPTAVSYQNRLLENLRGLRETFTPEEYEELSADRKELIREISRRVTAIKMQVRQMTEARKVANHMDSYKDKAFAYEETVRPYLESIRDHIDHLEMEVDDEIWPLPKYRELLFTK